MSDILKCPSCAEKLSSIGEKVITCEKCGATCYLVAFPLVPFSCRVTDEDLDAMCLSSAEVAEARQ